MTQTRSRIEAAPLGWLLVSRIVAGMITREIERDLAANPPPHPDLELEAILSPTPDDYPRFALSECASASTRDPTPEMLGKALECFAKYVTGRGPDRDPTPASICRRCQRVTANTSGVPVAEPIYKHDLARSSRVERCRGVLPIRCRQFRGHRRSGGFHSSVCRRLLPDRGRSLTPPRSRPPLPRQPLCLADRGGGGRPWCDVVSFNRYHLSIADDPAEWTKFHALGKPALIGEFHFGSVDRGLFWEGLVGVGRESERGPAYAHYLRAVADNPDFVGAHWFQYLDEPLTGRTLDGGNAHISFVTVADLPYQDLASAAREANLAVLHQLNAATRGGILCIRKRRALMFALANRPTRLRL